MGMFFSNVHIKNYENFKSDILEQALIKYMEDMGCKPAEAEAEADVSLKIYTPENSGWVSVCSELMDFSDSNSAEDVISNLSDALKTDVLALSCFDSDYLFLNLINNAEKINAWANVGYGADYGFFRRTNPSAWKKKLKNANGFLEAIKEKNLFAEEILPTIEKIFNMAEMQSSFSLDISEEIEDNNVKVLHFAMPEADGTEEPTMLGVVRYNLSPCKPGEPFFQSVVNKGGASKGIAILLGGDYVENDEIEFRDIVFEYGYENDKKSITVELEKRQTTDGKQVYYWENKDFLIPEKVKPNLPEIKIMKEEFKREFGIRFTPFGNKRKFLDICIYFIPLSNFYGQCCWCVWHYNGSKRAFIKRHNEGWASYPKEVIKDTFLDENDYDLD